MNMSYHTECSWKNISEKKSIIPRIPKIWRKNFEQKNPKYEYNTLIHGPSTG